MADPDYENMSDDDFANIESTPPVPADTPVEERDLDPVGSPTLEDELDAAVQDEPVVEDDPVDTEPKADLEDVDDEDLEDPSHTTPKQTELDDPVETDGAENKDAADDPTKSTEGDKSAAQEPKGEEGSEDTPKGETDGQTDGQEDKVVDFESNYKRIMAPFRANGKDFKPENPDEAIRLMQMGANYVKKMQSLKPNLKMMKMLENNNLLDEGKLSFLIDLDKKDPAAITKLLHDSKIDPLELDTTEEPTYTAGNHAVSDTEHTFSETLDEVVASEGGKETVRHIDSTWDKVSKDAIYREPAVLTVINEQRANGIYAQISAEMDRMQTVGTLNPDLPFIEAYKLVGDKLDKEGAFTPNQTADTVSDDPATGKATGKTRVVETRAAIVKPTVTNGEKAKAASSGKPSSATPAPKIDIFNMSDDEISQITTLRV